MRRITGSSIAASGITCAASPIRVQSRSFNQLFADKGARNRSLPIPACYTLSFPRYMRKSRPHRVAILPRQKTSSIPRRALLMGGFCWGVSCAFPGVANAATAIVLPAAGGSRQFSVLYKGFKIGAHTVSYSSATGETRVDTDIDLSVKVAFRLRVQSPLQRDLACGTADVPEQRNGGARRDMPDRHRRGSPVGTCKNRPPRS